MPRCLMLMGCLQKMLGNAAVDQVPVVLSGLGVFTSHKHPEYVQENPQTGAMTMFPPRITYHIQSEQSVEGTPCAELLAEYAHTELDEAASFVEAVVKTINNHLQAGEEMEVPGIGTFKTVRTHQSDLQHIDYLPCEQMKELVNAPFSCFEPYEISSPAEAKEENEEPVEVVPEIPEVSATEEQKEDEASLVVAEQEPTKIAKENVEEEPAHTPNISIHRDGHIIIKQEEKKEEDNSTQKIIYISLSLILLGCGFLLWLMFGDRFTFNDVPPTEAKVVEAGPTKPAPFTSTPKEAVPEKATEDSVKIAEPAKPVKAEPKKPAKVEPAKTETPKPAKEIATKEPAKEVKTKEFHRMKDANGKEVTVKLEAGSRLTLVALEHFGDKSFWPYIFDVNTDKLKAPNLVKSGMVLHLPDPSYYGIDAKDPASVQKAKNRAAQLQK